MYGDYYLLIQNWASWSVVSNAPFMWVERARKWGSSNFPTSTDWDAKVCMPWWETPGSWDDRAAGSREDESKFQTTRESSIKKCSQTMGIPAVYVSGFPWAYDKVANRSGPVVYSLNRAAKSEYPAGTDVVALPFRILPSISTMALIWPTSKETTSPSLFGSSNS